MASYQKYRTKGGELWLAKFTVGIDPATGKYKHTTKRGFETKKAAESYVRKTMPDAGAIGVWTESSLRFEEVLDQWYEDYAKSGVKKSTLRTRRSQSIPQLKRHLGKIPIKKITRMQYQNMLESLTNQGIVYQSILNITAIGKMIFNYAIEKGYLRESPADRTKIPQRRKTVEDLKSAGFNELYLEKNELIHFLHVVKEAGDLLDFAIFQTLAYTGMRIGELLALQWDDVNFKEKNIRVIKTLYRENQRIAEYELTTPKTTSSTRKIYVDDDLLRLLQKLRSQQEIVKNSFLDYLDENFVFAKLRGKFSGYPESHIMLGVRLHRYLDDAKIGKNISLHKFRHTHVSLLAEAGASLPAIQERTGHINSKTTADIYMHVTKAINREIVSQFSNLLKS